MYELILIAVGVMGLAWLFASSRTSTARTIWSPGDKALTVFRLILGGLTVYVLLTAGGIATILGLLAAFFGGLHLYFTRPDEDLGVGMPRPLRWVGNKLGRLERLLVGGR